MKIKDIPQLFLTAISDKYPEKEIRSIASLALQHVFKYSKTDSILNKEEEVESIHQSQLLTIIKRLKQSEPIQYILGETFFYGNTFLVNNDVLIPRHETEELVNWIIKENSNSNATILDVGTGSGCIAISLKKNFPLSTVIAIDISEKALQLAKQNADRNNCEITFIINDILQTGQLMPLPQFDIIVSNPPYILESEKGNMLEHVLQYEPSLALFVPDEDPLLFYIAIGRFALLHLKPNGKLFFEINEKCGNILVELMQQFGFSNICIKKDTHEKDRMLQCS